MAKNREIISKIYDHVECGDIDKAVFACIRLSRSMGDIFNAAIFLRELYSDKKQLNHALYDETDNLKEEAREFIWKTSFEHWIEGRTLGHSVTDDPDKRVLTLGVGEMQKEIAHSRETISDLNVPGGMGEYDTAEFTDIYDQTKSRFRLRISGINTIQERIRTRCMNYASRAEKQLDMQDKTNSFLGEVQNLVNCYFSSRSDDTFRKLQKATKLLGSNDPEDNALLLAAIRRAINSVADYFYPPVVGEVLCHDGKERKMGKEQYLNRLHEFCCRTFKTSTSNELIRAESDCLMIFARRLNDIASKGIHTEVSPTEAKQGLVGLYLFLSNVIEKIQSENSQ